MDDPRLYRDLFYGITDRNRGNDGNEKLPLKYNRITES